MEYKIKKSIASNIKESYSIEGEDAFQNIDIDCAEGINTVSFSDDEENEAGERKNEYRDTS